MRHHHYITASMIIKSLPTIVGNDLIIIEAVVMDITQCEHTCIEVWNKISQHKFIHQQCDIPPNSHYK